MCGRFSIDIHDLIELVDHYTPLVDDEIELPFMPPVPGEYFPSSDIPILRRAEDGLLLDIAHWSLVPHWWKKPLKEKTFSSFNARAEGIEKKATFRDAWKKCRRCIIPATEFYEWPDPKLVPKRAERPRHAVSVPDQRIFAMAGIWDECRLPDEKGPLRSCAIITTKAHPDMSQIPHTRMPVILKPESVARWLDPATSSEDAAAMLKPYEKIRIERRS